MAKRTREGTKGRAKARAAASQTMVASNATAASTVGPTIGDGPTLVVVFGDQLTLDARTIRELDPARDTVLMVEVAEEATHVPSHVQRTTFFLSAMRHFARDLEARGVRVRYVTLDDPANAGTFTGEVARALREMAPKPTRIRVVEPGEHRVRATVRRWSGEMGVRVEVVEDEHFVTPPGAFEAWAHGRATLTMEYFYREQRRRLDVLMEEGKPVGGVWNYDHDNRESFPKTGPRPRPPRPRRWAPDDVTREVMAMVARGFPSAPGRRDAFEWPVTRADAQAALEDFVAHRLPLFGPYEDAMWTDEPFVYHSALSPLLNVKLLSPRECVEAALAAYAKGAAPLQSVEAFVRQVIGWREYIRGVYDHEGAAYEARNYLGHYGRLPHFYWTGDTDMACVRECVTQVVDRAFGHHIQRLMVLGNFALTAGVHPREVSDWFLAMYADGVDWATLPNALGMAMHADGTEAKGPVVGTKPYAASGAYVSRMSNYCTKCRYDPAKRDGADACPLTVFYWDFLRRHRARFERNPRMAQIIRNLDRFGEPAVTRITISARSLRERFGVGDIDAPREPFRDHAKKDYSGSAARAALGPTAPLFEGSQRR